MRGLARSRHGGRSAATAGVLVAAMLCALGTMTAGCTAEEDRARDAARIRLAEEKAKASAQALGVSLMGELAGALAEGPPEDAVEVCARIAQEISQEVSQEFGATVQRTALRVRHPANAPDDWERAHLERWAAAEDAAALDPVTEVVEGPAGRELRWLGPIVLQELCTTCHGDREAMTPALRERIAEHYPDDAAVGFSPGDLRGAFSVRVPLEE